MRKIILMLAPILFFGFAFEAGDVFTVNGNVLNESGVPVAGVSITEINTPNSATTKPDGSFKIAVAGKNAMLEFSAVGYETQEIKIKGRENINVVLKPSKLKLEEVVVIGYGNPNTAYQLEGKVSGVIAPGSQKTIRGYHGINSNNDRYAQPLNNEGYDFINENRFLKTTDNPLSTFSIDVDAASYSNVRRYLNSGHLPPEGAVRIEEMINYFKYDYPVPVGEDPFSINTEISDCPWNKKHKLVVVGLQGEEIATANLPPSNLVFLIDVSGSMNDPMKLPLVKASMKMLTEQLRESDKVSIVVYAGAAGLVLSPTSGSEKEKIKRAIDNLEAGGSTAGGAGIKLAYATAKKNFKKNGNNRVILCTDGDFNIGASSDDAMERLIEQERKSGVFLTVLGYGMGNYKDNKMQKLADKGNGNHAYIDGMSEAKKVLVNEFGGTLFTIAKDVKLQVEFNPAKVQGYRLIGYENRVLNKEDFNDDKKDAGELGSGHTVTALYEIIPVGVNSDFLMEVDSLKYQPDKNRVVTTSQSGEMMTIKFRYKKPDGDKSKLIVHAVIDNQVKLINSSTNFRFAAAVAEMGMLLRNSEFKSDASFANVLSLARKARGNDEEGYRAEFIKMVEAASSLAKENIKRDDEMVGIEK